MPVLSFGAYTSSRPTVPSVAPATTCAHDAIVDPHNLSPRLCVADLDTTVTAAAEALCVKLALLFYRTKEVLKAER